MFLLPRDSPSESYMHTFLGYRNDVASLKLDKLNTYGIFMWHLTKNMNGGASDTNGKEL